jgi:hypothetical protein
MNGEVKRCGVREESNRGLEWKRRRELGKKGIEDWSGKEDGS